MGASRIRWTRLASQAAFSALSLAVYFGWLRWRPAVIFHNSFQVFPSISARSWAVAFVLLSALAAGRLFCGWLCPAGFLQDLSWRGWNGAGLSDARPCARWRFLKFLILAFCLASALLGFSGYHLFDHSTNLGRAYSMFRAASSLDFGAFAAGLGFIVALLMVPAAQPRWFCNCICPSGTLFSLLQRASLWRLRVSKGCSPCGLCADACPANCIVDGRLDLESCVHCLECIDACPPKALEFAFSDPLAGRTGEAPGDNPMTRRQFLLLAGSTAAGAWSALFLKGRSEESFLFAVVPPGSLSMLRFHSRCTGCGTCAAACPTKVLALSGLDVFVSGKVRMDFNRSYCAYDCNACLAVCPSGAISYRPISEKRRIKIGSARISRDHCIPWAQGHECGQCALRCPTGAISLKPRRRADAPVVDDRLCIGCGACQWACPARPGKAIVVGGLPVHGVAG
jgi:ferredoxin